ncbi:MAG: hypothetical protein AB8G05_00995 [Oligoflexales bacterium]
MKNTICILISIGMGSLVYGSAYVTDDEDLISTDSNYSEDSKITYHDISDIHKKSLKNIAFLIAKGSVEETRGIWVKTYLEKFYEKVYSFLNIDLSKDTFNDILEIKNIIARNLFISEKELIIYIDPILDGLKTTVELLRDLLPSDDNGFLSSYSFSS